MKSLMQEMVELLKKIGSAEVAAERLIERAYDKGFDNGVSHAKLGLVAETDQEKRDRLVKKAHKDIEELKHDYDSYRVTKGLMTPAYCNAKFIVNKEKRTVVVILMGRFTNKIRARGIAKCAPNDCFNEHIGKAIALHRALGLDVPQEYLDVPNPTEARVGNVVDVTDSQDGSFIKKEKVVEIRKRFDKYYPHFKGGFFATHYKITDDSESERNV